MRSAVAVLTYRRSLTMQTTLSGLHRHCAAYPTAIFEDCGQRDDTETFLKRGRAGTLRSEYLAHEWAPVPGVDCVYPNWRVFLGQLNLGVSGNSNRALHWFMTETDADHLCLCNDDLLVDGDFVNYYARGHTDLGVGLWCFCDFTDHPSYKWTTYPVRGYGVKFLPRMTGIMISITRQLVEKVGYFDVAFGQFGEEHPCPHESPVWMADYTFKPIGEVRVGDHVMGWERRNTPAKRHGHEKSSFKGQFTSDTLTKARVTHVRVLTRDVVKVTFASGRSLVCAPEHTWLNYHGVKPDNQQYIRAEVGRNLVHVVQPAVAVEKSDDYTFGYVNGLIAGDGGIDHGVVVQRTTRQEILDRLHACLKKLNMAYTVTEWDYAKVKPAKRRHTPQGRVLHITRISDALGLTGWKPSSESGWRGWLAGIYDADGYGRSFGQSSQKHPEIYALIREGLALFNFSTTAQKHQIYLKGGWRELVRFWNTCGPVLSYKLDDAVCVGRFKTSDKVVSIEPAGRGQTVYCLTTTTGNYVVHGYASKNCDYTHRCRFAGGICLDGQDMGCLDLEHKLLRHQECETSVVGAERQRADQEAVAAMHQASQDYAWRDYHRPYQLILPRNAGGHSGAGIPIANLLNCGYRIVSDLALHS